MIEYWNEEKNRVKSRDEWNKHVCIINYIYILITYSC